MSRRTNVSQADFDQCIENLLNENITPSVTNIIKDIGGSYTTIGTMFRKWKEDTSAIAVQSPSVPDDVLKDANQLVMQWWNRIQEDASHSIRQIQESSARQVAQTQSEIATLLEALQEMESEIDALNDRHSSDISVITKQHKSEVKSLEAEIKGLKESKAFFEEALSQRSNELQQQAQNYASLHTKYTELVDQLTKIKS